MRCPLPRRMRVAVVSAIFLLLFYKLIGTFYHHLVILVRSSYDQSIVIDASSYLASHKFEDYNSTTNLQDLVIPKNVTEENRKIIFFGTPFFGSAFNFSDLPSACRVSTNQSDILKADAVVFHMLENFLEKPVDRSQNAIPYNQVWVGLMYESAAVYPEVPSVYNWTMTFRRDSDIYSPYCGTFDKAPPGKTMADIEPHFEASRRNGTRKKQVAWMVSNCGTANHRLEYAFELSKYIQVDIYGACSPNGLKCQKSENCWAKVANEYKFYLSFESRHCKDYITEKFYMPMYYGMLPIVYGGSSAEDYRALAPPHSYLDTRDFESPQQLAELLLKLDASPQLYEEYFTWRKSYSLRYNRSFVGQDVLCAKLWNLDKFRKENTRQEFLDWWLLGSGCGRPPYTPQIQWLRLTADIVILGGLVSLFTLAAFKCLAAFGCDAGYNYLRRSFALKVKMELTEI